MLYHLLTIAHMWQKDAKSTCHKSGNSGMMIVNKGMLGTCWDGHWDIFLPYPVGWRGLGTSPFWGSQQAHFEDGFAPWLAALQWDCWLVMEKKLKSMKPIGKHNIKYYHPEWKLASIWFSFFWGGVNGTSFDNVRYPGCVVDHFMIIWFWSIAAPVPHPSIHRSRSWSLLGDGQLPWSFFSVKA